MTLPQGYLPYMFKSIEFVERTRSHRLHEHYALLTLRERKEILNKFHPDYQQTGKRVLQFGPNKGDHIPDEVANILEAEPWIEPDTIDLTMIDYQVDLLILGGGGAGMTAALWAIHEGLLPANILLVQKLRLGDSNSVMSQGGVQFADKPYDSPVIHYLDALGGGHFTNNPELVRALVLDAPRILQWHQELGIAYDRAPDGSMITLPCGGSSENRLHSARDYTGMEITRNLRDEVINHAVPILEFTAAIELVMDDRDQVAGAILTNMETQQYHIVKAKATILATGGFGRLHVQNFQTTNHYGATGDGLVLAYRVGAKLRDMDSVQYHPTGAAYPEQIVGLLVTEKVRNLGAQPVNRFGEQFVNPLEPRDVETSAIIRECYERGNGVETPTGMQGVWLDTPMIDLIHGQGTIEKSLPAMFRQNKRFGIDMRVTPILVFPTLHFQNGGVEMLNDRTETSVSGLFAAGEVTGGTHGKNRLMGNSILDYSVYGRRAGIYATRYAKTVHQGALTLKHVTQYRMMLQNAHISSTTKSPRLLPEYRGRKALSRSLQVV
jgi:succinate dehydrogenase / fumarate reductase flavoprotein subunit